MIVFAARSFLYDMMARKQPSGFPFELACVGLGHSRFVGGRSFGDCEGDSVAEVVLLSGRLC